MGFALVAVGYNRVKSMERLIKSLLKAEYFGDKVDLIISIDNSGNSIVEEFALTIDWPYGSKHIKTYPERLGLRNHILHCGDLSEYYDAIAVFEDDIYVAPTFYNYMKRAIEKYIDCDAVAGISLYSHMWREYTGRPFCPEKKSYDNYFMQYAQSWGQVWMPKQWKAFKDWYLKNDGDIVVDNKTPSHLLMWANTSWLKYHIKYCIDQNKYFVYPYMSFTTNFVEIGQHCKTSNTLYQVPMEYEGFRDFKFCNYGNKDGVYYDAFFERIIDSNMLGLENEKVLIDLYGSKKIISERYLLTTRQLQHKILRSYGLQLRPHELNVIHNIPGNDIFLYDLTQFSTNKFSNDPDYIRWNYESRVFDNKFLFRILVKILCGKIMNKMI